jgi:hypothetical protein
MNFSYFAPQRSQKNVKQSTDVFLTKLPLFYIGVFVTHQLSKQIWAAPSATNVVTKIIGDIELVGLVKMSNFAINYLIVVKSECVKLFL